MSHKKLPSYFDPALYRFPVTGAVMDLSKITHVDHAGIIDRRGMGGAFVGFEIHFSDGTASLTPGRKLVDGPFDHRDHEGKDREGNLVDPPDLTGNWEIRTGLPVGPGNGIHPPNRDTFFKLVDGTETEYLSSTPRENLLACKNYQEEIVDPFLEIWNEYKIYERENK